MKRPPLDRSNSRRAANLAVWQLQTAPQVNVLGTNGSAIYDMASVFGKAVAWVGQTLGFYRDGEMPKTYYFITLSGTTCRFTNMGAFLHSNYTMASRLFAQGGRVG